MKRPIRLLDAIIDRENLRLATLKALRGKRHRDSAREFTEHLDENLVEMADQIRDGSISVGKVSQFVIYDPKERVITAPCFRERVLHHAIMNVCEPHFDRRLIHDTYACRKGKGRIACLLQAQRYAHQHSYFLKCDIRKYFDSIRHDILLQQLERRFNDPRLLHLFERIIHSYRGHLGMGLAIGSLTSQHFANGYLSWHDRLIKETYRIRGYVRYMDDMAIWSNDPKELKLVLKESKEWLRDELTLEFKATPHINRTRMGMDFLGCRVFDDHMTLNRRSRRRFQRKLRKLVEGFESGILDERSYQDRVTALLAFTTTKGISSWKFRQAVLRNTPENGHRAPAG